MGHSVYRLCTLATTAESYIESPAIDLPVFSRLRVLSYGRIFNSYVCCSIILSERLLLLMIRRLLVKKTAASVFYYCTHYAVAVIAKTLGGRAPERRVGGGAIMSSRWKNCGGGWTKSEDRATPRPRHRTATDCTAFYWTTSHRPT